MGTVAVAQPRSRFGRKVRRRGPVVLLGVIATCIYAFLYLPAVVIAVYSFNSSAVMSWPLEGFTLDWYSSAFNDEDLVTGLKNSLVIAAASTSIALVLGVPAGVAIDRIPFKGKGVFTGILMAPFLFPGVISGLTLLTLFIDLNLEMSLRTVIVGHTTMLLGVFVILTVIALSRWDRTYEDAAMDLGASSVKTFFLVVLPNLRTAIIGAILLSFTVSLDEISRTFFLTGTDNSLPMVVMSMLHIQITPEINAIGTCVIGVSLVALAVWSWMFRPRTV
ncbi:MAG: ABC transporter permease [Gaiellales bacterium]